MLEEKNFQKVFLFCKNSSMRSATARM